MVVITEISCDDDVRDVEITTECGGGDFGNGSEKVAGSGDSNVSGKIEVIGDDHKGFPTGGKDSESESDGVAFDSAIVNNHEIRTLIMEKVKGSENMVAETNVHDLESECTPQRMEDSNSINIGRDNLTEKAESTVSESEELQLKSLTTTTEVNVEDESDDSAGGMTESQKAEESVIGLVIGCEDHSSNVTGTDDSTDSMIENQKDEETVIGSVTGSEDHSSTVTVTDDSSVTFPATFVVGHNIEIQFGSFGPNNAGDTNSEQKISILEIEPECDANNNKISETSLNDLQEESEEKVICEGGDDMDDDQRDSELPSYNFMVRIPRIEDEKLSEQIKDAAQKHDEYRRRRDAISAEIKVKRANMRVHNEAFNAASLEIRTARQMVKSKRQEMDQVQGVLKKIKNAISAKDIDSRIHKLNHMIEHETLCLKDEKQFIQEIKQLKSMRNQLASGSQDVLQHAVDQKDYTEELLKNLKVELKTLKDEFLKAEGAAKAIEKKYNDELEMEKELRARFIAAEGTRQEAYEHLNSLRKLLYDKNKIFHMYREDVTAARRFASHGDKASLHYLCANQVERFMDKWNTDEEFRKDYVNRRNMYANRRKNTVDETSRVLSSDTSQEIASNSVHIQDEINSTSVEKQSDVQTKEKVAGGNKQIIKTEEPAIPTEMLENKQSEETDESRKADELMKEESEAKLKEQRRLEEKMKANEAIERKKRNAEKAQTRAEMQAKKEAEQKEKARLKRLRKRERKRVAHAGADAATTTTSINGGDVAESNESKVIEKTNEKPQQRPPPHSLSKYLKPKIIPPPPAVAGAIQNRRRWQQWQNVVISVILLLFVFSLS